MSNTNGQRGSHRNIPGIPVGLYAPDKSIIECMRKEEKGWIVKFKKIKLTNEEIDLKIVCLKNFLYYKNYKVKKKEFDFTLNN